MAEDKIEAEKRKASLGLQQDSWRRLRNNSFDEV